jgi:hypothetical protein
VVGASWGEDGRDVSIEAGIGIFLGKLYRLLILGHPDCRTGVGKNRAGSMLEPANSDSIQARARIHPIAPDFCQGAAE